MSRKFRITGRAIAVVTLGLVTALGVTGATTTPVSANRTWCC